MTILQELCVGENAERGSVSRHLPGRVLAFDGGGVGGALLSADNNLC